MFYTYTLNYEEEIKNRPIPENAVNVLAALKKTVRSNLYEYVFLSMG